MKESSGRRLLARPEVEASAAVGDALAATAADVAAVLAQIAAAADRPLDALPGADVVGTRVDRAPTAGW
jgi:hypothetical protein